jgi:rubrerythrin
MWGGVLFPLEQGVEAMFPSVIKNLFGGASAETVLECRRCGESVSADGDGCPHCGPEAPLAEYVID